MENKYFELKKLMGLLFQLELLAVFSRKSGHDNMSDRTNATTYAHTVSMGTHSFTQAWAHRHRQTVHIFPFFESLARVVPNNLASHAHCVSAFKT